MCMETLMKCTMGIVALCLLVLIFVFKWLRKNGKDDNKDRRIVLAVSCIFCLSIAMLIYFSITSAVVIHQFNSEITNGSFELYAFVKDKQQLSPYEDTKLVKEIRKKCKQEETYSNCYDKLVVTIGVRSNLSIMDYLRAITRLDYLECCDYDCKYKENTEQLSINGEVIREDVDGSVISMIGNYKFRDGSFADMTSIDATEGVVSVDKSAITNGAYDRYQIVECSYEK